GKARKYEFDESKILMRRGTKWNVREVPGLLALEFLLAAISQEGFESFLAGILVQQAFPLLRIRVGGTELIASFAYLREPFFVFRAELIFELLPEALGEGRALPSGRNGDLQRPTLDDRRVVEIA